MPMHVHEVVADLFGCNPALLDNVTYLESVLCSLAAQAGTKVVSTSSHTYQPQGASVIVFVEESHLLISTWPEHGIAVFNCLLSHGPNPCDLINTLQQALEATRVTQHPISRQWIVEPHALHHHTV